MTARQERILWKAVLGGVLISSLVTVLWLKARRRAQQDLTKAQVSLLAAASSAFATKLGRWPTSEVELVSNAANLRFIYPPTPFPDAWGHPFVYQPYTTNAGFGRVLSYGRDGKPGGTGGAADIERRFP